jgi:hypothetical protein
MTAPRCDLARRHARHRTQREGSGEGSSKEKHDENVELETWDSQGISAKLAAAQELEHDMHYRFQAPSGYHNRSAWRSVARVSLHA